MTEAASDGWEYQNVTKAGKVLCAASCCVHSLFLGQSMPMAAPSSMQMGTCNLPVCSRKGAGIENVAVISILVIVHLRTVTPFQYEKYECMIELRSLHYCHLISPLQREE